MLERESIIDFDHIPSVGELFEHTKGRPGVEYAIVSNNHVHDFIGDEGWKPVHGAPIFKIGGHPCAILGRGTPINGMSSEEAKCPIFIDTSIPLAGEIIDVVDELASDSEPNLMDE